MLRKYTPFLASFGIGLFLIGAGLLWIGLLRSVTLLVDGQPVRMKTRAFTVRAALEDFGLPPNPEDRISPPLTQLLGWNQVIRVERTRRVSLWLPPYDQALIYSASGAIPGNLLAQAGVRLFPGDRLFVNGEEIAAGLPLLPGDAVPFQLVPASPFTLNENGRARTLYSAAATVGAALRQAGITIAPGDLVLPSPETALAGGTVVELRRAVPVQIEDGGRVLAIQSAAATVGEALAQAGLPLQGLDFSQPEEQAPLPVGGSIRVTRVREQILLEQTPLAYDREFVQDPDSELDQVRVLQVGRPGIQVTRTRVRFENGQETSRGLDSDWIAAEPQNEKVGYGTKVVVRTLDTPSGPLEYWRAVNVYATAYSPCRSGTDKCYFGTAGGMRLQRGVVGVTRAWYNLIAGQRVYVPGYGAGVIADVGGGIPGKRWIDLGFTDDDFEPWHQNTVLYFLTPVPENIPWILP